MFEQNLCATQLICLCIMFILVTNKVYNILLITSGFF